MSKVTDLIRQYQFKNHVYVEGLPGGDAAALPAAPAGAPADPLTAGAPPGAAAPPPVEPEEDDDINKTFEGDEGNQNYIDAVKDMRELLIIDLDTAREIDEKITSRKIDNLEQAFEVHDKLREIIDQTETKDLGV